MEVRPLTLGAAGGSFSAIAWKVLAEVLATPSPPVFDCPELDCDCAELPSIKLGSFHLDLPSLALGVALGLLLGPVLELFVLIRASWGWWVRSRLREYSWQGSELYRLA